MPKAAFHEYLPDTLRSGVVFASPHSGSDYPAGFVSRTILDDHLIRSSEDAFVDQLFAAAPRFGMPLLTAGAPRAYVDLNRAADELDPALIDGILRKGQNPRVASGLGVIPRVVANGRSIYRGKIPLIEAQTRIERYWRPYHTRLRQLLDQAHGQFGQAILIDCHSMPHEAVQSSPSFSGRTPDIVLGDRFGASARSDIVDQIESAFAAAGLTVARNAPFAGAYVTQAYGRPGRGRHAIQVEIDRSLYMDERAIRPNTNFEAVRNLMTDVIRRVASLDDVAMALAAE